MLIDAHAEISPNATSRLAERIGLRYLVFLNIIPVLAFIFPFCPVLTSRLPESYGSNILEFSYNLGPMDADIVIFGDSSAIFDDNLVAVQDKLNLKVVNLPNLQSSLAVTRDEPLRRYLASNKAPRLIVFQFTPWDMNVGNHVGDRIVEGQEELIRHGTLRQIAAFTRSNLLEMAAYPFRFYVTRLGGASRARAREPVVLGHSSYTGSSALQRGCVYPASSLDSQSSEFVRSLVARYTTPQTRTMVFLSAIPDCMHVGEIVGKSYADVGVMSPLTVLPAEDFADDLAYAHVLPLAVPTTTQKLTEALERELGRR
jgi:hypothetical protein